MFRFPMHGPVTRGPSLSDPVASAYSQIRGRILAGRDIGTAQQAGGTVIVLTSRRRQEGVTTVCLELALSLQDEYRGGVLLVDSSPPKSDLVRLLKADCRPLMPDMLSAPAAATAESVAGLVSFGGGLSLPVLQLANTQVLESPGWPAVLDQLRQQYPILLVDSGSIESNMPHLWSRWATRMILVIDASQTTIPELERRRSEAADFGFKLQGAILNKKPYYVPRFLYRHLR